MPAFSFLFFGRRKGGEERGGGKLPSRFACIICRNHRLVSSSLKDIGASRERSYCFFGRTGCKRKGVNRPCAEPTGNKCSMLHARLWLSAFCTVDPMLVVESLKNASIGKRWTGCFMHGTHPMRVSPQPPTLSASRHASISCC